MTDLFQRTKIAAEEYRKTARKPIVIEFAGVPKAGKTSNLEQVLSFFKRCGFSVESVAEQAAICPVRDKKHPNFNIWTACTTLAQLLEKTQAPPRKGDPDILFVDRGIFDAICWMRLMNKEFSRLAKEEYQLIEKFLSINEWRRRISAVIVMTATPEKAIRRERGELLPDDDSLGSIMNPAVLKAVQKNVATSVKDYDKRFNLHVVDTDQSDFNDLKKSSEHIADIILGCVERHLEEKILHLKKSEVKSYFPNTRYINGDDTKKLITQFCQKGKYAPRKEVEKDETKVQALPIVVVRTRDGGFLRLTRREIDKENPLDNKDVIWAGGHVRQLDDENGNALVRCAVRELMEELKLSAEEKELRLVGAVYIDKKPGAQKHVSIVYEWKASGNSVNVVVSGVEFKEKQGTSVRVNKKFYTLNELLTAMKKKEINEEWSVEIINAYALREARGLI